MKISELEDTKSFSCEFYPPLTEAGMNNLLNRAERLVNLGAKFISVTWGAGGTSADRSIDLAKKLTERLGPKVPIVLHLTCTNMNRAVLDRTLAQIAEPSSGIDNILALRGDRPRNDYLETSEFEWAIDLVKYIREHYSDRFCIGVAAYTEGFTDSPTMIPDVNRDLEYLADKIEAGAEFIITQVFYDPARFGVYAEKVRKHPRLGPHLADHMLFPGLMPIINYRVFLRSSELCHASIPINVLHELKRIDTQDDEQVKRYGVKMLSRLLNTLMSQHGVRRIHFFTLNLEKNLTDVLIETGLATSNTNDKVNANKDVALLLPQDVESSASSSQTNLSQPGHDEFVNGRYTNPNSAAFGEIDGYGPIVHGALGNRPNPAWGNLTTFDHISQMFVRHITNELPIFPFGDQTLSAETALIQEQLIELNLNGIWTLASQPAAHNQKSTDRILGWGPPNGHVFQYAYVECLIDSSEWMKLRQRLKKIPEIAFYAASESGSVDTNCSVDELNVVTWGIWGENRVEPTIIAHKSFLAWRDEVFEVIRGWQQLYSADHPTFSLLRKVAKSRMLVAAIYRDSREDHKLWDVLLAPN